MFVVSILRFAVLNHRWKQKGWAQGIYMMPQFHRYDMAAEIIEAVK